MLTPLDIDNKSFKKVKIGGYDIQDVEDFLVQIMDDYEKLYKENTDYKQKVDSLQESLMYYKSIEDGVSLTVETAKQTAEEIKETAIKEAEVIKKDAQIESKKDLEEIKLEIKSKQIELEELKKQMQIYKIKVTSMLEAQLKILKEED